jgi:hypothetical protein
MRDRNEEIQNKLYKLTFERLKAEGLDVTLEGVSLACKSRWGFISTVMRFGQHESFRDKYFGTWGVKMYRPAQLQYRHLTPEEKIEYKKIDPEDRMAQLVFLKKSFDDYKERTKMEYSK